MTSAKKAAKARKPYILAMDILGCLKRVDRIPWVSIKILRDDKEMRLEIAYRDAPLQPYRVVVPRLYREPVPPPEATETTEGKDLSEIMGGNHHALLELLKGVYPDVHKEFMERGIVVYCEAFTWLYEYYPELYNVIGILYRDGRFK